MFWNTFNNKQKLIVPAANIYPHKKTINRAKVNPIELILCAAETGTRYFEWLKMWQWMKVRF